ncbi:unnamed protein product [Prunus brigantina]
MLTLPTVTFLQSDRLHPTNLVRLVGGQPWDARLRSSGFVWGVDFHLGWLFANLTVSLVFISSLLSFVQPFQSSSERFSIRDLSLGCPLHRLSSAAILLVCVQVNCFEQLRTSKLQEGYPSQIE